MKDSVFNIKRKENKKRVDNACQVIADCLGIPFEKAKARFPHNAQYMILKELSEQATFLESVSKHLKELQEQGKGN